MKLIVSAVVVVAMFIVVPLWIGISLRQKTLGQVMYGPEGKRKSTAAMAAAFREFDRLVAKPSIEYRIEAEDPDKLIEDEKGGE